MQSPLTWCLTGYHTTRCRCMEIERIIIDSQDRLLAFCQVKDNDLVTLVNPCPVGSCRSSDLMEKNNSFSLAREVLRACRHPAGFAGCGE